MQRINNTRTSLVKVRENLATAIALCPVWLQTCWFMLDGEPPSKQDEDDFLSFLTTLLHDNIKPEGVLLYSLARPTLQPEAPKLAALSEQQLEAFAARIRAIGIEVKVAT